MEFTAFGIAAGYLLAGSVDAEHEEEAFELVLERIRAGLIYKPKTTVEIVLFDSGREFSRRSFELWTGHGKAKRSSA